MPVPDKSDDLPDVMPVRGLKGERIYVAVDALLSDGAIERAAQELYRVFAEDEGYTAPVGPREWEHMARCAVRAASTGKERHA